MCHRYLFRTRPQSRASPLLQCVLHLALERLGVEFHTGQAIGDQSADVAVVAALRSGLYRAVMLAESQQGFFVAQAFEQGKAEGLARALVLPCGVFDAGVDEALRLVFITFGDEGQGLGERVFAGAQAGAQGVQISHAWVLWRTRPVAPR